MIVTCPSCAVRYVVDARALGVKGRVVRCARCANTWHQAPPPPDDPLAADAAAPLIPLEPPQREREAERHDRAPPLTAEQRRQLPAVPRRKPQWGAGLAWALTAITLLAGLGYAAIVERDRIVGIVPAAAAYYARAGFPVTADSGLGLEFRNVTTSREMANGLPSLVIAGEVKNVSSIARAVPKLVVTLRDRGEHDLQDMTVAVPTERLQPGESVPFHASITQPAEAASGVVVTFAGGSGG